MHNQMHQGDAKQAGSQAIKRQRLSTLAVPQAQRFDYWLNALCSMYVELDCEAPGTGGIFGDIEFSRIGSIDMTHLSSNTKRVKRSPARSSHGNEDYCLVHLQQTGRGIVCQDDRTAWVDPGDFVLYDCTRPYELVFEDSIHDVAVMRLPRASLEAHVGNLQDLTATTVSAEGAAGNLLLSMVSTLRQNVDILHPASALGISEAITNVVAAGLRSLPGANAHKSSNLSAYHIARIKSHLQENLRDPQLSVTSIALALKVTPGHLSRLFRTEPVPLSRLIWQWRLDACKRDLVDPRNGSRSVSDIAFSWGFNDAAHFSRCFKEQFGCAPREWRNQRAHAATAH